MLDTETRTGIPLAALRCLEAGLSPAAAMDAWFEEVFPVVGANLLEIAGEWAGWDADWVVAEVARVRAGGARVWAERALLQASVGETSRTIGAALRVCLDALAFEAEGDRVVLAADLSRLAAVALDFCARPIATAERERVASVYAGRFWQVFGSVLSAEERAVGRQRVEAALAASEPPPSSLSGASGAE